MNVTIKTNYGENVPDVGYKSRWFYKEVSIDVEVEDPNSAEAQQLIGQWSAWLYSQCYALVQVDVAAYMQVWAAAQAALQANATRTDA